MLTLTLNLSLKVSRRRAPGPRHENSRDGRLLPDAGSPPIVRLGPSPHRRKVMITDLFSFIPEDTRFKHIGHSQAYRLLHVVLLTRLVALVTMKEANQYNRQRLVRTHEDSFSLYIQTSGVL